MRQSDRGAVRLKKLEAFSEASSIMVSLIGCTVLAGWWLDIKVLRSGAPGLIPMNPATAVAVILAGQSLWLSHPKRGTGMAPRVGRAFALIVALIGLWRLLGYLCGWTAGIDTLLFSGKLMTEGEGALPNRIAPNTALGIFLVGLGLLSLDFETRRGRRPSQVFILMAAFVSLMALAGYAYGVKTLYGVGPHISMALITATTLTVLCVGVLSARPSRGLMGVATGPGVGSMMARRLLPAVVGIPLALGWLRLEGERARLFDTAAGAAMVATATVVVLAILTWSKAGALNRISALRERADEERRQTQLFLDSIVENIPNMVFVKDAAALRFVLMNRAGEGLLGLSKEELIGKSDYDFFPKEQADFFTANDRHVLETRQPLDIAEEPIQAVTGERFLHTQKVPILDEEGTSRYLLGISEDITDRKQAQDQITELNRDLRLRAAQLESANKELEAFSYSVSHDLRAPVRHIGGFVELLQEQAESSLNEEGRRYLNKIAASARRMGELIDDLLVFSRMGRVEMRSATVDLARMVAEVKDDLAEEAKGRRIDWQIGPMPRVRGDAALLKLALTNLISNALKYTRTRDEARVEIGCQAPAGEIVVFVRDNGVGFDPQYSHKLFGVFQRLHRAEEFEGTGVGLASVRQIISRHGGRTWAQAEVDRGAAFFFSLPKFQEEPK